MKTEIFVLSLYFIVSASVSMQAQIYEQVSELPKDLKNQILAEADPNSTIMINEHGWNGSIDYIDDSDKIGHHVYDDTTYYFVPKKIVIHLKHKTSSEVQKFVLSRENIKLCDGEKYSIFYVGEPHIEKISDRKIVISAIICIHDTDVGDLFTIEITPNNIAIKERSIQDDMWED